MSRAIEHNDQYAIIWRILRNWVTFSKQSYTVNRIIESKRHKVAIIEKTTHRLTHCTAHAD